MISKITAKSGTPVPNRRIFATTCSDCEGAIIIYNHI